jgi:hypothetical protein
VLGKCGQHRRRIAAGHLEQHHKAGGALDECRDVRIVRSGIMVSFPMTLARLVVIGC